jgi:glutamate synthase domain-containing protein 2
MKLKFNEIRKKQITKKTIVYDLTVNNHHSYCIGKENFIVHNCLTTVQTGVGYPLASLIQECYTAKRYRHKTKIIADGGFKKYSDIIKALGLGADYVMIGSIFNKCLESAGETTNEYGEVIDQYSIRSLDLFSVDAPLYKVFRGMSTKEVQRKWGKEVLTTSEGIVTKNKVEYTLPQWCDNFESYLRSAMSYSGKDTLSDFIGNVNFNLITDSSFRRFNK